METIIGLLADDDDKRTQKIILTRSKIKRVKVDKVELRLKTDKKNEGA